MIERARKHGLTFFEDAVEEVADNPKGSGVLHVHRARLFGYKMGHRKIAVQVNNKLVKTIKPKIHQSAVNRVKAMGKKYNPKKLAAIKGKYEVVS